MNPIYLAIPVVLLLVADLPLWLYFVPPGESERWYSMIPGSGYVFAIRNFIPAA
jgi:hypothetical protein